MTDKFLDFLILALVVWLVYDRMKEKQAAKPAASASTSGVKSTQSQVEALLNAAD